MRSNLKMENFNLFDLFGNNDFGDFTSTEAEQPVNIEKAKEDDTKKKEKKENVSTDTSAPSLTDFGTAFGNFDNIEAEEDGDDSVSTSDDDEKKPAAKVTAPKTKAPKTYDAPISVVGCGWMTTIGADGDKLTSEAIVKALYDAGFHEVIASSMHITKNAPYTLYVNSVDSIATTDDIMLSDSSIELGNFKVTYSKDNFDGLDEKEISVFDVALKFQEQYPSFKGCGLKVGSDGVTCVPTFSKKVKIKENQEYQVWTENGIVSKSGSDLLLDKSMQYYSSETDVLFSAVIGGKGYDRVTCGNIVEAKKLVPAAEVFHLPLDLWLETYGRHMKVTGEDFGGKDSVTKDDVISYLKGFHRIFSSSNRQFSFNYDRDSATLGIAIISGKKGAAVAASSARVIDFPLWKIEKVRDRIENTAIGIFKGKETVQSHLVTGVDFKMTLPKIPSFFLTAIIAEFKKDLTKENMVQVYYSVKDKYYYMVRPEASYDKISVKYKMNHTNDILVISIHSHNTMKAIFSRTDNEDEIYTGLFGVIGDLDKPVISMSFRAGMEGSFKELSYSDIFDMGGTMA